MTSKIIIISLDIIFSRILSTLHFYDDKRLIPHIGKTVKMVSRYIASFIWAKHTNLLDRSKVWITYIDGRDSRYDGPVFTPLCMRLKRESLPWLDDKLLHLIERKIFEDIVDSPWTITNFEIASFGEIFR